MKPTKKKPAKKPAKNPAPQTEAIARELQAAQQHLAEAVAREQALRNAIISELSQKRSIVADLVEEANWGLELVHRWETEERGEVYSVRPVGAERLTTFRDQLFRVTLVRREFDDYGESIAVVDTYRGIPI